MKRPPNESGLTKVEQKGSIRQAVQSINQWDQTTSEMCNIVAP